MKKVIPVTYSIDKDGDTAIVSVPMCNLDKQAVLNLSDFNLLMELKVSAQWKYVVGQVFEKGAPSISIARLIMDAGKKEAVQYIDRDAFNLRRSNLVLSVGSGKQLERNKLKDRAFQRDNVTINPIYINPSYIHQIN